MSNPPLHVCFSWSYLIITSSTFPYCEKKFRRSTSVKLDGSPPKKTVFPLEFRLGAFVALDLGLQGLGSICNRLGKEYNVIIYNCSVEFAIEISHLMDT